MKILKRGTYFFLRCLYVPRSILKNIYVQSTKFVHNLFCRLSSEFTEELANVTIVKKLKVHAISQLKEMSVTKEILDLWMNKKAV